MHVHHLTRALLSLLGAALLILCSCDSIPDEWKIVQLKGQTKTVTVGLTSTQDRSLSLNVDLRFVDGDDNPITVYPCADGEEPYAVITYPADFDDYGFSAMQTDAVFSLTTAQNHRFVTDEFSMTVYADIDTYTLVGSMELTADLGAVPMEALTINVTGGADVDFIKIDAETVALRVDGAADIALSGNADTLTAKINGAAALESLDLAVSSADVTINGIGEAEIACTEELRAEVNGAGSISYVGNPTVIKEINGVGAVSALPENAS